MGKTGGGHSFPTLLPIITFSYRSIINDDSHKPKGPNP